MRLKQALIAAALVGIVALGGGLWKYGEWLMAFSDSNLRILFPEDAALTPPGPEIAPDVAAFAGIWAGDRWAGGALPHALVVERLYPNGAASVIYAWGADQVLHRQHGFTRVRGHINGGHLRFSLPDLRQFDYSIAADGRLLGSAATPVDWREYVLLDRIEAPSLAEALAIAAKRPGPLWEDITIPEASAVGDAAGRSFTLSATLYRTKLPARQKLIIFNPGQIDSKAPEDVVRMEEQGRLFLAQGFSIVVPMRKGRGDSGGPMIESRDYAGPPPPKLQIDSGVEDIDAVVEEMKKRPFVDPGHIVVAGNDRGGLLAVAYAGHHSDKVHSVVNFSGGWWPEAHQDGSLNTETFAAAGRGAKAPMLWLYAEGDPLYGVGHIRKNFEAFRAAGGNGQLSIVPDPSDLKILASQLYDWTAKWDDLAADWLRGTASPIRGAGMTFAGTADPEGGSAPLEYATFYPSPALPHPSTFGATTFEAVRNAAMSPGTFPLVLISAGFGGDRLSHHDSAVALAREGFIVVTTSRPGASSDNAAAAAAERSEHALVGREYEMRAVLDAVLADPVIGPQVDPARIGVAGSGTGGFAALLLAGGKPDFRRLAGLCAAIAEPGCDGEKAQAEVTSGQAVFTDPRIKAAFLMAPAPGFLFADDGLHQVEVPVRIERAGADRAPSAPYNETRIRGLLPRPPEYEDVAGAGPASFLAPCGDAMRQQTPERCSDPQHFDRVVFHEALNRAMVEYFRRTFGVH